MVLLIFLGSLFISSSTKSSGTETKPTLTLPSNLLPSLNGELGGGLQQLNLTPFPTDVTQTDANKNCKLITNDIMLVIDNSGSMKGEKLKEAKFAAKVFVQLLAINPENRMGLVVFNKTSTVMSGLTQDYALLNAQIDRIGESSNTCIQCGVLDGNKTLAASQRTDVKRSIVLLSDGKANHVNGVKSNNAKEAALAEIKKGFTTSGISYYTIAFGKDADINFMLQVALMTSGMEFSSVDEKQLTQSFTQAATAICSADQ